MPIQVGDRMPEGSLSRMTAQGPTPVTSQELFGGKTVVLFAVPGAFTPVCNNKHLPTYLQAHDALKAKGVDTIACLAVNDVHVMNAWGQANQVGDRILMLADGNGDYARALGMDLDLTRFGMGVRSKRYAMLIEDGVVRELNLENPGEFKVSGADQIVCRL